MSISLSTWIIPALMVVVAILSLMPNRKYFDAFIEGAKEGAQTTLKLLPVLCAFLVALSLFSASGAVSFLGEKLAPLSKKVGIPAQLLPLLLTRPLSGSASTATFMDLISQCGVDSFPALCAAVIMGSSDTMLYVISIYFSATRVKKTRHALPVAAAVMIFCIVFSCFLSGIFFGNT